MQKDHVAKMQLPGDSPLGMEMRPFLARCGARTMWLPCHVAKMPQRRLPREAL